MPPILTLCASCCKGVSSRKSRREDFDAAFASTDALAALDPKAFRQDGPRQSPSESTEWLEAQALGARARSYADMPAAAWTGIAPLSRNAPALPWLRAAAADIEAQRGWARRAEADIEVARSLAPDDFGIRLAQVDSDVRRHRLARADERIAPLLASGGDLPEVRRVKRELDAEAGPNVKFGLTGSQEEGEALRAPGSGGVGFLRVESGAFDGLWRLVGVVDRSTASAQGLDMTRNRAGAGILARWPDVEVEALAWSQTGSLNTNGGSLAISWELDDHWTVLGSAAYHSPDAPLRADAVDVSANVAIAGVRYAWHESAEAEVQVAKTDFSDGNDRLAVALLSSVKVLDRPHLDINLRPRFDWQRNSRVDTFYFSPGDSWGASLGTEVEYVTWRAYERVFTQRAMLTVGAYDQQGFGSRGVGAVLYEHGWRHDPNTELVYGVQWSSNVYDGQRETSWMGYLTLVHKFGR